MSASMAITEKPRRTKKRPTLAMMVVLLTLPFLEVMTMTRGGVVGQLGLPVVLNDCADCEGRRKIRFWV
ncbi:hypothetical protein ACFX15_018118 [Malus domestica]